MADHHCLCGVCDLPVLDGQEWIGLNRYAVGTGDSRCLSEVHNGEGDYLWTMSQIAEDELATLALLHWPVCAQMWVDVKIASVRAKVR